LAGQISSACYLLLTLIGALTEFVSLVHARQHDEKAMTTRKSNGNHDELRSEYDVSKLRGGTKGKYYAKAAAGSNLVLIEPDLTAAFPNGKAVNDALRVLVKAARGQVRPPVTQADRAGKVTRTVADRRLPAKKTRSPKAARG
jgi:hypothetical protein